MVSAQRSWTPAFNPSTGAEDNRGQSHMERNKIQKHAPFDANISYAFPPFLGSSFGGLGDSALMLLMGLTYSGTSPT